MTNDEVMEAADVYVLLEIRYRGIFIDGSCVHHFEE
jgi:hypothetical protein